MGIAGIGDAFSGKYPTMQIFGKDGSWHVVPIRKVTGSMIVVKIAGKMYPFLLDASKFRTYRYRGAKTIQTILYSLEDAIPLDLRKLEKLEENAAITGIRKIDAEAAAMLLRAAELLIADTERDAIDIDDIAKDMDKRGEDPGTLVADFAGKHNVIKIVRPVPEITEYLTDRLMLSPSVIATGIMQLRRMDNEWRKIANPAKAPFGHWLLVLVVGALIAVGGGIAFIAIEEGWFDGVGGSGSLDDLLKLAEQFPGGPGTAPPNTPNTCLLYTSPSPRD